MPRTYRNLSDHDFELLVADLLSAKSGIAFRVFAPGPDAGIDLRGRSDGQLHIVQCKHYARSTWSQLRTAVGKELAKLKKLDPQPTSYRLATTQELNAGRITTLVSDLDPYLASDEHVIDALALEQLLDDHPEVERRQVKLWLTGGAALHAAVNADIVKRSAALLARIEARSRLYVQTAAFDEARRRLRADRVCVIAGPAGVGKTVLAHLLVANAVADGYEAVEISGDADEAWKLLDPEGRPQVFLYDDFLGHTSLTERLARNEEHRLVDFLDLVANSDDRLFVLTTREHLFGQAQQTYVRLGEPVVDAHRFVLPMEGYSELERARILYTHLYFAEDLTGEAKQSVVADEAYRRVLAHSNYNPRLLAGAIDAARKSANDATFCGALIAALDDPLSIWRQSYSEELSDQGRAVLMTLASFAERVELSDLGRAFEATCLRQGLSTLNFALDNALKAVQGTFVRIDVDPGADLRFVAPVNPSVSDFLQQLLSENTPEARVALESATFFEQLQGLWAALSIIADGQPTAPADELADGFAAALVRTLDAPTASWDRVIYGRRDGTLHYERQRVDKTARALDVLAFAHSTPTYERVLGPLAGQAVDAAVTSWNDKRSSQFSALRLAAVLDERDELSGQIKQRLADRILAVQYQPADFRALLMLRERHPELVDSDAMAAAKRAAYAWIEDELTNQLGEMADPSEVSELMDLAETMELDVDPKRFQAAAREVQERLDEEGDAATDVDATSAPAAPEAEEAADGDAVRTLLARLAEL